MKRRQHYVWQHYLRAWATNGQLQCYRAGGSVFRTSTVNVAVERDFYRLRETIPQNVALVRRLCIDPVPAGVLRSLLEGWIPVFTSIFRLREQLERLGIDTSSDEARQRIVAAVNDTGEELHTRIETGADAVLDGLRRGTFDVLSGGDAYVRFLHFLCVQYTRTKKR